MGRPVNTVASGGTPVVDNTGQNPKKLHGIAVSEAPAGFGMAVTQVSKGGQPVIYVVPAIGNP
jgi:hypothetical protein